MSEAKSILQGNEEKLTKTKGSRRENSKVFLARLKQFLRWEHVPADKMFTEDFTKRASSLKQVAPALYGVGLLSKAGNFQDALLKVFEALSRQELLALSLIGSHNADELQSGCQVAWNVLERVTDAMSCRKEWELTSWIREHVDQMVQYHMGWIIKLGWNGLRLFQQCEHGELRFSKSELRYGKLPYSATFVDRLRKIHADVSCALSVNLACTIQEPALHYEGHAYHDKWLFRTIISAGRSLKGGDFLKRRAVQLTDYEKICPDQNEYIPLLCRHFDTTDVSIVAKKVGYAADVLNLSMHCCFTGWLRKYTLKHSDMPKIKRVRKEMSHKWKSYILQPFPNKVCEKVY